VESSAGDAVTTTAASMARRDALVRMKGRMKMIATSNSPKMLRPSRHSILNLLRRESEPARLGDPAYAHLATRHDRLRHVLRWLTAGESHGPALVAILEGLPSQVGVSSEHLSAALARRRLGYGRGARMKFEADDVRILGGIRHGITQGGPIAIEVGNSEWPKWERVMSADPVDPAELESLARNAPLTRPRPGHADLVGMQKYDFAEARPILERASARETAARVALGVVASRFLEQAVGARVVSHVIELGGVRTPTGVLPAPEDVTRLDEDPVRCLDAATSAAMVAAIDRAHKEGDTLGGVVEVVVAGLPPGLGSHVHWDRRLDAKLAGALMGIQAIKGVEVGDGFELAAAPGSQAHDEITPTDDGLRRTSGRSGGTEGGMSTGELLRVRAAMKPISTVPRALRTVDVATGAEAVAHHQRSDVCAVPAAGIVAEAMVALVLADAVLEKFGGDSVGETARNVDGYLAALRYR
jgi:chorismate synthase